MRIPVLASAFYNESLLIIFGIVLGIVAGGTAVAATLDLGSMEPQLRETMIQAQATIRAGLIQGTMTLAAGCAAKWRQRRRRRLRTKAFSGRSISVKANITLGSLPTGSSLCLRLRA